MRKILSFAAFCALLIACGSSQAVAPSYLQGYFLNNTYNVQGSEQLIVFKDKQSFDNVLGVAKTMTNTIDAPDFAKNTVAAIVCTPARKTEVKVDKIESEGGKTIVHATVTAGEQLTYTMSPVIVFQFPKEPGQVILKVNGVAKESVTL